VVQLFLIQLVIKRLFKLPPHPSYASALPGEIKTHEIVVKWTKNAKNHPWLYW